MGENGEAQRQDGGPNGIRTRVTDVGVNENALFRHLQTYIARFSPVWKD